MRKTILTGTAGVILSIGMLSGCATKTQDNKTESGTNGSGHEVVTITSFNNSIPDEFVTALHEKYPEINLERKYYCGTNGSGYAQYSLEQDDMTDIYTSTYFFSEQKQAENLIDLSSMEFVNNYYSGILSTVDVEGSIYLLPSGYNVYGITYNKTIMEENGWEVPQSFDELEKLITQIEEAGLKPFGAMMDFDGYPFNYFFAVGSTGFFSTQDGIKWKKNFIDGSVKAASTEDFISTAEYFGRYISDAVVVPDNMTLSDYQLNGDTVFLLSLGNVSSVQTDDGKTYEFGIMPWLSEDGSNNMLLENVNKFYGINKHLEDDGNEQKLEDAVNVLSFMSSDEGMAALMGSDSVYMSPLTESTLAEDHPYYEMQEYIYSGRIVPFTYVGWEELIIPIAADIRDYIDQKISAQELAEAFDSTYISVKNSTEDYYGTASEIIPFDDTMRLVAIAEAQAVDADCALVTVNTSHGKNLNNYRGVGEKLYAGDINTQKINVFRPNGSTISVLTLKGSEIKALQQAGFALYEDCDPFEYRLYTKNGEELDDDTVYNLAVSTDELTEENAAKSTVSEISPLDAIRTYTSSLGTFSSKDIVWQ